MWSVKNLIKLRRETVRAVVRMHDRVEVLADINFEADEHKGETIKIDAAYVDSKLTDISQNQDLSRYIL